MGFIRYCFMLFFKSDEVRKIRLIPTKDELKNCYNFGREFAEIVNGKMIEIDMN